MKKLKVALIDTGVDVSHALFSSINIPQFVCVNDQWQQLTYNPDNGHGTGIASILIKNAELFELHSYTLFAKAVSVPVEAYINLLQTLLNSAELYDIIHMSLGVRHYNKELEAICSALRDKGVILVSAFDNIGYVSYPAGFPFVIGVDTSVKCLKNDDFVYVGENSLINLKAKGGNQRIAWLNNTYMIVQGSSFAAAHVTAHIINLLSRGNAKANLLKKFKEKALYIYPEEKIDKNDGDRWYSNIKKAAVFPFNKETTSILRFPALLNFEITDVYDTRLSGTLGKTITALDGEKTYTVKNMDDCAWNFDTLVLGHTHELEYLTKSNIRQDIINLCHNNKKNIFSFDDELFDADIRRRFDESGLKIYYPEIRYEIIPQKFGKMYAVKTPVLGVFGTSSQQGKITLQLQLRRRLLRDGYTIGQIGSEPESILFGMDYVYPFGYRSMVTLDNCQGIEYLNYRMSEIDKKECDLILTGAQAQTIPMLFSHISNFPMDCLSFLLGTRPDAVILCVNFHDKPEDIKRTILSIESLATSKVIACSLFPRGFRNEWDIVKGVKNDIERSELETFASKISADFGIPCHILDTEEGPEKLYQCAIDFFSN
jgi:hypothetical protein